MAGIFYLVVCYNDHNKTFHHKELDSMFIGRNKELTKLNNIYAKDGFKLVLLCGKKGVGKTALIKEFCKDKDTIFFTAKPESSRLSLQNFSLEILYHYNDISHKVFSFWEDAFTYIKDKQEDSRLIIVLDEFSEIVDRDIVFMDKFYALIDTSLSRSNLFFIVSSSNNKFIKEYFTSKSSPYTKKLAGAILLESFLNDESIVKKLAQESMKTSKGVEQAKFVRVAADKVIIREGDNSTVLYKIVSGKAVCYLQYGTDNEYLLGSLKEGASFGEYSLLTDKPALYTVVAFTDMLLLRIQKDEFHNFLEMNPANALEIIKAQMRMLERLKINVYMLNEELHSNIDSQLVKKDEEEQSQIKPTVFKTSVQRKIVTTESIVVEQTS